MFTPSLASGALHGITRTVVMELAEGLDIEVTQPNLTRYDLYNADECFITGTAAEVVPVVKIDGRKIGTGRPGKHTKAFMQAYHALTNASGSAI